MPAPYPLLALALLGAASLGARCAGGPRTTLDAARDAETRRPAFVDRVASALAPGECVTDVLYADAARWEALELADDPHAAQTLMVTVPDGVGSVGDGVTSTIYVSERAFGARTVQSELDFTFLLRHEVRHAEQLHAGLDLHGWKGVLLALAADSDELPTELCELDCHVSEMRTPGWEDCSPAHREDVLLHYLRAYAAVLGSPGLEREQRGRLEAAYHLPVLFDRLVVSPGVEGVAYYVDRGDAGRALVVYDLHGSLRVPLPAAVEARADDPPPEVLRDLPAPGWGFLP